MWVAREWTLWITCPGLTPSSQDPGGHSAGNDIIDGGGWVPALYLEKTTLGEVPSWAFSGRETEDLGEDTAAQDRLLQCLLS